MKTLKQEGTESENAGVAGLGWRGMQWLDQEGVISHSKDLP